MESPNISLEEDASDPRKTEALTKEHEAGEESSGGRPARTSGSVSPVADCVRRFGSVIANFNSVPTCVDETFDLNKLGVGHGQSARSRRISAHFIDIRPVTFPCSSTRDIVLACTNTGCLLVRINA